MTLDMKQLETLALQQWQAELAVEEAELELQKRKEAVRDLREHQLPELMEQLGMVKYKTTDGLSVSLEQIVRASVSKDRWPAAAQWLREHGHGKLLKNQFVVMANGEEDARQVNQVLVSMAQSLGMGVQFEATPYVHAMTLGKFVRELLEQGAEVPLDLFGVFRQTVTKVKL